MTMSLKRVKSANKHFKFSVFGYLRDHEKQESINIPMMIKYICLNYYLLTDKFTKCGNQITLHDDNHIAIDIEKCNTAYGEIIINDKDTSIGLYEWTFNVKLGSSWIGIGIDSSNKEKINSDFTVNDSSFCAVLFDVGTGKAHAWYNQEAKATQRDCPLNMNEVSEERITMILDVFDRTLKFERNGQLLEICIYNIDMNKDYHMAVGMGFFQQTVKLTKFMIQHKLQ